MRRTLYILGALLVFLGVVAFVLLYLGRKATPDHIIYGMSFNAPYALELGLDPQKAFVAMLDELHVKHLRLAAHWTVVEPAQGVYDWSVSDFQLQEAEKRNVDVIFGVGRRLPRWPECHVPPWAKQLSWDDQKKEIRQYLTETVNRYKDNTSITYWQVENEPFLSVFATDFCGPLDEDFLKEEIALVHVLDPTRPVLVTDSGNLGTWRGAYSLGDAFGTSVYVYFWNPQLGQFRSALPPFAYRVKEGVMRLLFGAKRTFLIELSLEPWLVEPLETVPLATQFSRMDAKKFDEIIAYAKATRYDTQYLWGVEWWYWLKLQGYPEMWEKGKTLFNQ